MLAENYFRRRSEYGTVRYEVDDLVQESYFALLDAVKYYKPGEGAFITFLGYTLKNAFARVNNSRYGYSKTDATEAITKLAETVGAVKEARETAAGEASAWKLDFDGKMDEIISTMETSLEKMDMSEEAIAAAASTMTAYAESVSEQGSLAVQNALAVANEVRAALQSANTTITVRVKKVEASDDGYASGTNYAIPGPHWVGEKGPELLWFNGGEKVLDARASAQFAKEQQLAEMQIVSFLPLMQNYLNASGVYTSARTNEPTYAKTTGSYNSKSVEIHNNITIEGNATEETVLSLEKWSEDLREMIRDEVGEISENNRRSIYT